MCSRNRFNSNTSVVNLHTSRLTDSGTRETNELTVMVMKIPILIMLH